MSQEVYGIIRDNGDGSSSMCWYKDLSTVMELLDDDDQYYANEGSPAETLTFPDDLDLDSVGFFFED